MNATRNKTKTGYFQRDMETDTLSTEYRHKTTARATLATVHA